TYIIRDGLRLMEWSTADRLTFFSPDFMRRQWFLVSVKSQLRVSAPEEFFLRPVLEREEFPTERHIQLSSVVEERIRAQDTAGHLVFDACQPSPMQQVNPLK